MRQQERQRYYDYYLSEQRKKGGLFCLSKCYEHALPGKLQCHKAEAEKVNMKGGNSLFQKPGIAVKDPDKKFRKQLQDPPASQGIDHTDSCNKFNCFFDSVVSFFSVIKAHDRRSPCGKPLDRHSKNITDRI